MTAKDKLCCAVLADRMMANGVHSDSEIMVGKGATKTHGPQNQLEIFDFSFCFLIKDCTWKGANLK